MSPDARLASGAEPGALRLVATLALAGLLSGLIIVTAFEATQPTIAAHQARVLRRAVLQVLPGATHSQRLAWRGQRLVAAEDAAPGEQAIFAGRDAAGALVGYAIPAAGPGFQDTISLLYGYRPGPGRICGLRILESRETPGLGDKIYKDPQFRANFQDLAVHPEIRAVKHGTKSAPNQVDAITGATISSKAVVRILNQANALWLPRLPPAGP
jgi:electron transport complex protein RnfG